MKPKAALIRKVAHREGVSYKRAVRMLAARGGRVSAARRQSRAAPTIQPTLF